MKNVLLYDTHPICLQGLTTLVSSLETINITATSSPDQFQALFFRENFDLVIFGINTSSDFHVLSLNDHKDIPWIANFSGDCEVKTLNMLSIGVKGCISKATSKKDLITCIKTVLAGDVFLCHIAIQLLAAECLIRPLPYL